MPRDRRAVIGTAIWREDSIRALPTAQQHAYFFAYTQGDLNRCGVVAYRPKRWAGFATDATERHFRRQFEALHKTRHVVLDEDYDELLVRTYLGHDGLLAQPLVVVAMVREFHTVSSPAIRTEVLRELRRLWPLDTTSDAERRGILLVLGADPSKIGIADGRPGMCERIRGAIDGGLRAEITLAIDQEQLEPWPDGPEDPFVEALAEGLGKGSGKPPTCERPRVSPAPTPAPTPSPFPTPTPSPRATEPAGPEHTRALSADIDKPDPVDPEDLVAQHLPAGFPRPVRQKLITATAELLTDGLSAVTIGAALDLWTHREGAAPGLLPYLAADVQLDDLQPKKPTLGVNGSAPPWCGDCDETSRWHEGDTGWYRCPKCHPLATPTDTTDDPWTPPTALTFDAADVPPF